MVMDKFLPKHIAVVMDGNGRWAAKNGLPRAAGHKAGAEKAKEFIQNCFDLGIQNITLFAFSSENWLRPEEEIAELFKLFDQALLDLEKEILDRDISIKFIGDFSKVDRETVAMMEKLQNATSGKKNNLILALSYGGRAELVSAARNIAMAVQNGELATMDIDEHLLHSYLQTSQIPDPDLFIRTSGEQRLSNFMLWQLAYTELYFTNTLWPDFTKQDLLKSIEEFQKRERRYGKRPQE